jgi:hypothetical protein
MAIILVDPDGGTGNGGKAIPCSTMLYWSKTLELDGI